MLMKEKRKNKRKKKFQLYQSLMENSLMRSRKMMVVVLAVVVALPPILKVQQADSSLTYSHSLSKTLLSFMKKLSKMLILASDLECLFISSSSGLHLQLSMLYHIVILLIRFIFNFINLLYKIVLPFFFYENCEDGVSHTIFYIFIGICFFITILEYKLIHPLVKNMYEIPRKKYNEFPFSWVIKLFFSLVLKAHFMADLVVLIYGKRCYEKNLIFNLIFISLSIVFWLRAFK